jgi:putative peptidoglycan lipid II flippase
VKVAFVAMFMNIGLNFLFIGPLRNGGPALATSISAFFNSLALLIIFYKRYGSFGVWSIAHSVAKFVIASMALGVVAYRIVYWPGFYAGHMSQKVIALSVTIGAGSATYFAAASLLRTPELAELRVMKAFRRRGPLPPGEGGRAKREPERAKPEERPGEGKNAET